MGPDLRIRTGLPPRALGVGLAVGALLLSGCATMPDRGSVRRVDSPYRTEAESAVRVFGVSPEKGAQPSHIVWGFLEATTSDEARFATARKYLTTRAGRRWNPFAETIVLAGGPTVERQRDRTEETEGDVYTVVQVSGTQVGVVDSRKRYSPKEDAEHESRFHLIKVNGEWRIDSLRDGLVLGEADFQRIYRSVNKYYYAAYGQEAAAVPDSGDVLIPDPIYVRRRIDPVTDIVRALLGGPSTWLDPVVTSSFPRGTRLAPGQRLSLDDSGELTVRLRGAGAVRDDTLRCQRMASQVLYTVQDQASAKVSAVELAGAHGAPLCKRVREDGTVTAPGRLDGPAAQQYFIDGEYRAVSLSEDDTEARPVGGVLGTGEVQLTAVAVSRDELSGAGLAANGQALYVAPLSTGQHLGSPVLTSARAGEDGLTTPSWDGLGDLWVADRNPDRPRLLRLSAGTGEPEEIEVPGLGRGERITALRVASDGIRIAMLVEGRRHKTLKLGRVERHSRGSTTKVSVERLRSVAPQLEDVVAMSWAGSSRLVVVGRRSGGVQQMQYMETDGSTVHIPPLPGINDVTGIAASENDSKPVLADSAEGIVRLPPDANWRKLTTEGSAPIYPG